MNVKVRHVLTRIQSVVLEDINTRGAKAAHQRPAQQRRFGVNHRNDLQR